MAWHGTTHDPFVIDYAIIQGVKNMPSPCPLQSQCGVLPGLLDEGIDTFDARLQTNSPAIDKGTSDDAPSDDLAGRPRDASPDIGAYELWEPVAWAYLPAVLCDR
jgi:hypothetical protein